MSIGEQLRKEREKRGYSIEDIHQRLRIHPNVIRLLEENRFDRLPAAIYSKGFLKRYSEFLELNSQELLSEYDSLKIKTKEVSLDLEKKDERATPDIQISSRGQPLIPKSLQNLSLRLLFIGLLLIFGSLILTWGIDVLNVKSFFESPFPKKPLPLPSLPKAKGPGRLIASPAAQNFPKILERDPLELRLRVNNDVWVRVLADGEKIFEAIIKPGQVRNWRALRNFELKLGRPASVFLDLNGYPLGAPGKGQAKHVWISHEGLHDLG